MITFRGLDDLQESLRRVEQNFDNDVNNLLIRLINEVKTQTTMLTPVDTGTLRRAWTVSRPYKVGNKYYVSVGNNTEYAEYIEHGTSRTAGKHMLEIALEDLEDRLRQEINTFIRNLAR